MSGLTVPRTETLLRNRTPEVVSVRRFGARIDGTTDDSDAIQAAVDAGAIHGVPVHIPAGTSIVSKTIQLRDKTHLFGDGGRTVIRLSGSSGESALTAVTMDEVQSGNSPVRSMFITDLSEPTSDVVVSDLKIDGNGDAIQATDFLVSFSGLTFYNSTGSVASNVNIDDCNKNITTDNPGQHRSFCLLLANTNRARVFGGTYGNAGYESIGIRGGCFDTVISGASIAKHPSELYGRHGLQASDLPMPRRTILQGMTCTGRTSHVITHTSSQFSVVGCTFMPSGPTTGNPRAVMILGANDVSVIGCTISPLLHGEFTRGIMIQDSTRVSITNNIIRARHYSVLGEHAKQVSISSNTMESFGLQCIRFRDRNSNDSEDIAIVGNNIRALGTVGSIPGNGIRGVGVNRMKIIGNYIEAFSGANLDAVFLDGVTEAFVEGNTLKPGGTGDGIATVNGTTFTETARGNVEI